ncbi:MAG TPA: hypothetical protein VG939_10380 [Caulobacteraceae bacterium]|nr:hypothetical protein [Caulobacteraceae bacterium]
MGDPQETSPDREPELIEDGQEEVASHTAIERGLVHDPRALPPEETPTEGPAPRNPPGT